VAQTCLTILGRGAGKAIMLAVGGAQEALYAEPGTMDLVRVGRCVCCVCDRVRGTRMTLCCHVRELVFV